MPRNPRPRRIAALSVVLALVAACGPTASPPSTATPSPVPTASPRETARPSASDGAQGSPAPDHAAIYAAIEADIIEIRGLQPEADVDPQLLDEDELRERTEESFKEDNPPELIEGNEVLYRALGMLDEDASLTDLYIDLLSSQVAGFYDPESDELYVVARSGELGVSEQVTYAHEFTHALQDQHFDLEGMGLDEIGHGDRNGAQLALIEGDATAAMFFWAQTALTPEQATELLEASMDPEAQAVLERMPPILRESLTFPYQQGLQFVLQLQGGGGGWDAVNEAYADPPASTEQVLHPEKYAGGEEPIDVELPADLVDRMGTAWSAPYEDTFGEFQFQVWLRNALEAQTGNAAAAGWGGDRFAVLTGPDDAWALVMKTAWDTTADATEFHDAAARVVGDGEHPGTAMVDGREVTIVVASDGATLNEAASSAGFVISG